MVLGTPAFLAPELVSGQRLVRRTRRHLRARLRRLLVAHRPAAVRGGRRDVAADASLEDAAVAAIDDRRGSHSRRAGRARARVPVEGSRRPACQRRRALGTPGYADIQPARGTNGALARGGTCTSPRQTPGPRLPLPRVWTSRAIDTLRGTAVAIPRSEYLIKRAVAAAAILIFVDCMKELPATLLLRPLGVETLATLLYGEAARGTYENGAIAALLIVPIGPVPVLDTRTA